MKIISLVKYGNDYYSLSPTGVQLLGEILKVNFTSTLRAQDMTWVAAMPMILAVDANYQKIQYIENGNVVHELNVSD